MRGICLVVPSITVAPTRTSRSSIGVSLWGSTASGQPASFDGAGQSRDGFLSLSRLDPLMKRDVGISPIGIAIAAK